MNTVKISRKSRQPIKQNPEIVKQISPRFNVPDEEEIVLSTTARFIGMDDIQSDKGDEKLLGKTPQLEKRTHLIDPDELSDQLKIEGRRTLYKTRERLAAQQRLREKQEANKRWVWISCLSGLVCGIGNYFMGVEFASAGSMGPALTGPLGFVILIIYRGNQLIKNKRRMGTFVDYRNSNWWTPQKEFKREHLKALAGNFICNLLGLVFLSLGFKYASIGGLNQGILPTLNSLSGVYAAILFYYKFDEIISIAQGFGMVLMLLSVVMFGLEGALKNSDNGLQVSIQVSPSQVGSIRQWDLNVQNLPYALQNHSLSQLDLPYALQDHSGRSNITSHLPHALANITHYQDHQLSSQQSAADVKMWACIFAIVIGLVSPLFYTFKSYVIRAYCEQYVPWDLGIDALVCEHGCYCIMYGFYLSYTPFLWREWWYGCLISILFLVGKQALTLAYAEGPGGPVNTITITQSFYQTILDVYVAHQPLGPWGIAGFMVGILGTIAIALGNAMVRKCMKQDQIDKSPLRRFL